MSLPTSSLLHLDVDAFFAAVEQRDDPRLRGRPIAVGTGVVASCSYESRRWGVRTGMRLTEARQRCPGLLVLPGDYRRYELAGRRILGICLEYTPRVEVAALDDLYLDLTPRSLEDPIQLAMQLAEQVDAETQLSVSLGLAANKVVASVATDEVKRHKARAGNSRGAPPVHRVAPGEERAYLAPWPVEVLPGVGPKMLLRLEGIQVHRVGELADLPLSVVSGLFGSRGLALRDLARGIDPRTVAPYRPPQSVSRRTSFDPPVSEWPFLLGMLDHLLERACAWLRDRERRTRRMQLQICYGDYEHVEARIALPKPTDDIRLLRQAAHERLPRMYTRRLPLRALGVELSPLVARDPQGQLFAEPETERASRLTACTDEIRHRFGFMAVMTGSTLVLNQHLEHDRENFRLRTPCLTR